jgi:hypothetical protein
LRYSAESSEPFKLYASLFSTSTLADKHRIPLILVRVRVTWLAIPLIDLQGTPSYGLEGAASARVTDKATGQRLVDIFLKAGGKTIDSANLYADATSEKFLAQLDVKAAGIDTK